MIINHKYKFIFIKTRKTACTSVEIALSKYCDSNDIITPIFEEDELKRKILGFRGPQNYKVPFKFYKKIDWLRLIFQGKFKKFENHSTATFIKENIDDEIWNTYHKFCYERNPYDKAISRYFWGTTEPRPTIKDYIQKVPVKLISNWDIYTINDQIAVDYIGRFENLLDEMNKLKDKFGFEEDLILPRTKNKYRVDKAHYTELIDEETKKRIELVCSKEFKSLQYNW